MPKDIGLEIEVETVLLSEATGSQCRWIIHRERMGVFVICARQTVLGSSYCAEHHDRIWRSTGGGGNGLRGPTKPAADK